ncbi:MAG TPA: hypothetical protein VMB05_16260 [Solirubrobacteraceae bacterium]|nr:hypothetical protein [Solirubrobacteraceae bacterium]
MRHFARKALLPSIALAAVTLSACGSSHTASTSSHTVPASSGGGISFRNGLVRGHGCPPLIASALGTVAARIYDAASHGNVVGQAVHRVESSATLARAVAANDAPAASATLRSLLAGQIVRVQVIKAGKVFAAAGAGTAIAPVAGPIARTDARFVLSTQAAPAYLKVAQQITGANVVLLGGATGTNSPRPIASTLALGKLPDHLPANGSVKIAGRAYEAYSLPGSLFPAGDLRIVLLVAPASGASCLGSWERSVGETIGHVGERIYHEEADSPYVRATLRHIEGDAGFQRAVATRDTAAIRAAIVRFFAAHIHVVRVRAYAVEPSGAQRFLYDLGGPYVLAPVHGAVRSGGRVVGRFSYAIQDDAGYLRLAHLFTGAEILMRVGSKQVMGTLDPGPVRVPDHGIVTYRGKRYAAYSFTGEAFPSGSLRISLLLPSRAPIGG